MQFRQRIKGIAFGAAASLALYASGFLILFTPLPLLYVWVARGRRDGVVATLAAFAIAAAAYAVALDQAAATALPIPALSLAGFFPPAYLWIAGVGYFAFFAVVAVLLGEGAVRRWGLVRWGGTALVAGLAVIASVVGTGVVLGAGIPNGGFAGYFARVVAEVVAMQTQAGGGTELGFIAENAGEIVALMTGIAPSLVAVFALLTVALNMLVGRRIIRGNHAFGHVHNVARFRLPDVFVWAIVAGGTAFFADSYALHTGWLKTAALNVLIVFGALYFFQGLAVIVYFLQGIRAPLVKTMAYVAIIFFFQTIGMLIVAVGVADVWADFRLRSWRARHNTHQA